MSIEHMTWATRVEVELTTAEAFILLILGAAANEEGFCSPVQSEIARKCRLTRESVVRNIGSLRKKGLLELHRSRGNKVVYQLPDLVTQNHKGCDAESQGRDSCPLEVLPPHTPLSPKPPTSTSVSLRSTERRKRRDVSLEDNLQASEIIKSYPGYRLTKKEVAMCRGQIYHLMDKGLGLDTLADIMEDFVECYDLAKQAGERPRPWHPLKFFSDIERVTSPLIWRQALAIGIDEDDWETILYRNSIDSEPRTYDKTEK